MDPDPWKWSVHDVQSFFRDEALNYLTDMPHGHLPPLDTFLDSLQHNDVNGAILLTALDTSTLRDECGIKSLGVRGTIIHCIVQLRRKSPVYLAQQAPLKLQTLPSPPADRLPRVVTAQDAALASAETIEEHVRPGEITVQDVHGRKRRKLHISKVEIVVPAHGREEMVGYFPKAAHLIDELFYGETSFGQEVGELPPLGSVLELLADRKAGMADDNFQFRKQHKPMGEAEYVSAKMRYFLRKAEEVEVQRRGRVALGVLPYRSGLQQLKRSATVMQFKDDEEEPVAIRESAAQLRNDQGSANATEQSGGEWDFLEQKYEGDADELLPVYGDSETGDGQSETVVDEIDTDDMAAEEEPSHDLHADHVAELIETAVGDCIAKWHDRLPQREEKNAWSVWKKMKGSRTLRDGLIGSAQAKIQHLTARLNTQKDRLLKDTWPNKESLLQTFGASETTVEDREEQRWMITVWNRRQEPKHTVRRSTQTAQPALQTPVSGKATNSGFVVREDDRFSVSPAPKAVQQTTPDLVPDREATTAGLGGDAVKDGIAYEADDEFLNNSPQVSPGADTDIETPDDVYVDALDGITSEREVSNEHEDIEEVAAPLYDLQLQNDDNDTDVLPEREDSDSDGLPSPSTFLSTRKRRHQPEESSTSRTIDLTMGSSSSPAPRSTPGKRQRSSTQPQHKIMPGAPDEASAAEIATWDIDALAGANDRMRILIYLLHQAEPEDIKQWSKLVLNRQTFAGQLTAALQAIRNDTTEAVEPGADSASLMSRAAKIFLKWSLPKISQYDAETVDVATWQSVTLLPQKLQFTNIFAGILHKQESKMSADRRGTSAYSKSLKHTSSSAPIEISSSDDHPHERPTPRKTHKKAAKRSKTAQDSRASAFNRQQKYNESQSQGTDATRLVAMLQSDPGLSSVEINPVKDESDDPIHICDRIAKKMKPHQIDGARFLWREVTAEGKEGGQGCILAHTMGLGKTMQTIALLVAVNETAQSSLPRVHDQLPPHLRPKGLRGNRYLRVLLLCPPSLLQNWRREIDRWAPQQLGNVDSLEQSDKAKRLRCLEDWTKHGGVMLVGYQMFRGTVSPKPLKSDQQRTKEAEDEQAGLTWLLLEGPEIVVADEAHMLKNNKSSTAKAAERIRTESRIALTGTPMSNDVQEIYALLSWVAPNYLGDQAEFSAQYSIPIQDGLYADSTAYERRKSIKKLQVLHAEIQPKVNRANIEVLRGSLKPKIEFVITVPLGEVQSELYERFIKTLLKGDRSENASQVTMIGWLAILTLLTNHPRCFRQKLLSPAPASKPNKGRRRGTGAEGGASRDDTPEGAVTPSYAPADQPGDTDAAKDVPGDEPIHTLGFTDEMVQEILGDFPDNLDPSLSAKVDIFLKLLDYSSECKDKSLVFSTSIPTLNYLDDVLRSTGKRFGRIDGQTPMVKRTEILEDFHKNNFDIMLVSTRAGGVGLNIQGANRVFIFDFGFNPTWEEQAIGRAYRLGQTKPVFVYRFLAGGTFEKNIYNKQLFKTSLAQRVVDKKNPKRNAERNTREYLYEPKKVPQKHLAQWIGKDPRVLDRLLREHGPEEDGKTDSRIRDLETMETLQQEVMDEPLDEDEQREVNEEIEQGRLRPKGRKFTNAGVMQPPPPAGRFATVAGGSNPSSTAPAYTRPSPSALAEQRPMFTPHKMGGLPMLKTQQPRNG